MVKSWPAARSAWVSSEVVDERRRFGVATQIGVAAQRRDPQRKTAEKEFGLTREQVVKAIRAGKLQCREGSMHGNPWLRLLPREVEALVKAERGADYVMSKQAQSEIASIDRQLKKMKAQAVLLEKRRGELVTIVGQSAPTTASAKRSSRQ